VLHGIDAYAIDAIVPDKCLNPVVVSADDVIFLRVHVDQSEFVIPKPALLNLGLIVVVRDQALGMEIRLLVERIERGEGGRRIFRGKVVYHDVKHQVHISLVQSIGESLQVVARAKVVVERKEVLWPVPGTRTVSDLLGDLATVRVEKTNPWYASPYALAP